MFKQISMILICSISFSLHAMEENGYILAGTARTSKSYFAESLAEEINTALNKEKAIPLAQESKRSFGSQADLEQFKNTGKCRKCNLEGFRLTEIINNLQERGKKIDLESANCNHTDMSDANLQYANLRRATIYDSNCNGTNFSCADLSKANLWNSTAQCANFTSANLIKAALGYTNFYHSDFTKANLSGANLQSADFNSALFYKTILTGAKLHFAKNLDSTWYHPSKHTIYGRGNPIEFFSNKNNN